MNYLTLFGVKAFIFIWILTVVWWVLVIALDYNTPLGEEQKRKEENKYPWWYSALGFLFILSIIGILYCSLYVLFVVWG